MCRWISALYLTPTLAVRANKAISPCFCPVQQYATMMPVAIPHIHFNTGTLPVACLAEDGHHGFPCETLEMHHKVDACTDDLLLFVTSPDMTFPNLLREQQAYGELFIFKVNFHRLEGLNLLLPHHL